MTGADMERASTLLFSLSGLLLLGLVVAFVWSRSRNRDRD